MAIIQAVKMMPVFCFCALQLLKPLCSHGQTTRPAKPDSLWLTSYGGGFEAFIAEAIATGKVAVIDKNITALSTIEVPGDLVLLGKNRPVIQSRLPILFLLKQGNHVFRNFNIEQSPGSIAFSTFIQKNIIWDNKIQAVNVTGGRQAYASSQGGLYDAASDAVIKWSGTSIEDCVFKTSYVCVSIFSQDGPAKFLHMRNVDLYSDTAHNIYAHPNVSLRLYGVRSMKVGTPGLAIHHYSGGGGENGRGVASNARYVEIKKCSTNWDFEKGGMWQVAEPISGAVLMDSCDLAPYSTPLPNMLVSNTRFFNGGGGAYVKGKITNCSGTLWPTDGAVITGGNFEEMNLRGGGNIVVRNAVVTNLFGDQKPVNISFENTVIAAMKITNPDPSKVILKKGSKVKSYLWGWKPGVGLLVDENRKK